jgi:hypothetical protein
MCPSLDLRSILVGGSQLARRDPVDALHNRHYLATDAYPPIGTFGSTRLKSVTLLLRELILHLIRTSLSDAEHHRLEAVLFDQLVADLAETLEIPVLSDDFNTASWNWAREETSSGPLLLTGQLLMRPG